MFRKIIGISILVIGASLCRRGGWAEDEQYEDLSILGKIGSKMVAKGLKIAMIDVSIAEQIVEFNIL